MGPIPKAGSVEHQRDNLNVFDFALTEAEMETISGLTSASGRIKDQDPATYEEF
jgi:diketogulonate reductase-like aldo/keto reductase